MHIPLLDLKRQYQMLKTEIDAVVAEVFESQYFILGPKVKACEDAIAKYSNCAYGVGVSSGTDALLISLMAEDLGAGDEVVTTPYSFFATAGVISRVGARPIFVDIHPMTYNLDPSLIEEKITSRTKAIMPVHLFGQMADMDPIMEIADKYDLTVIEDAAQAIGAEYKNRRAGSIGHYGCFSFFPSKNLGGAGDGGMVVTNDARRADKLRSLRVHGSAPKYYHKFVGGNFRLDELQAAVVFVKLRYLDQWIENRQSNAARYNRLFDNSGLVEKSDVILPIISANRHVFNQYVVRIRRRDEIKMFLKEQGISSEIYYPLPLHLQECFWNLNNCKGDYPTSEKVATDSLALPIFPEMLDQQAAYVVDKIIQFLI